MLASLVVVAAALNAGPGGPFSTPSPSHSTTPSRIVLCPVGDAPMGFVIRSRSNVPVESSLLILDFIACPAFVPCGACDDPAIWDPITRTFRKEADVQGAVTMSLCGGGLCAGSASVYADGVAFGTRPLAPFDQNGDHLVDAADVASAQAKVGTSDRSADFDGDTDVDAADIALIESHYGHHCLVATPAERSSWGRVKSMYR